MSRFKSIWNRSLCREIPYHLLFLFMFYLFIIIIIFFLALWSLSVVCQLSVRVTLEHVGQCDQPYTYSVSKLIWKIFMSHICLKIYPKVCILLIWRQVRNILHWYQSRSFKKKLLKLRCVYLLNFILVFEIKKKVQKNRTLLYRGMFLVFDMLTIISLEWTEDFCFVIC